MRYAWAGAIWLCLSGACGEKSVERAEASREPDVEGSPPPRSTKATDQAVQAVPGSTTTANGGSSGASGTKDDVALIRRSVTRKARACVMVADGVVRSGAARGFLSRHGTYFDLLVSSDTEPKLELWQGTRQGFRQTAALVLESSVKRAAFTHLGERAFAAWVDERAHLMLVSIDDGKFGKARSLAEGVDRRMPPALAHVKSQLLLGFTRSVSDSMHVHVAHVEGERSTVEDLTPPGHGAGAPTFIEGLYPPSLVAVDAHAGVSPLLEIPFDDTGRAQPAVVRTPVSQPYAPPALAAAQLSPAGAIVAFTAIGKAAATAIGLVPLRTAEAPTALVPSNGYGELAISASQQNGLAVFAAEAFKESGKESPRKVLVGVVDGSGSGEMLELGAQAAQASAPNVHAGEGRSEFSVAYSAPDGVHVAELICSW